MARAVRYYLGRVVKGGMLDQALLRDALLDPVELMRNKYTYTFVNVSEIQGKYIVGKIAKFRRHGEIEKIDRKEHIETKVYESDVKEVSSMFLYIPKFSGIVYQHIWNDLQKEQFESIFPKLVTEKFYNTLVDCEVDPVVDLRAFADRLSQLEKINKIRATVKPPNPLFGPCWESLKDHLAERNAAELIINEQAKSGGLNTNIQNLIRIMLEHGTNAIDNIKELLHANSISDSAVLMAADGYGTAKIEGEENAQPIVIRTKQNQKTFLAPREPDADELYELAYSEFSKINDERYLDH